MHDLDDNFVMAASLLADYCENSTQYEIDDLMFVEFIGGPFSAEQKLFHCCSAYMTVYWRNDCENQAGQALREVIETIYIQQVGKENWILNTEKLSIYASKFKAKIEISNGDVLKFLNDAPIDEVLTTKKVAQLLGVAF